MPRTRREFLTYGSLGMLATALRARAQSAEGQAQELPPGAPPAFGTAPAVGPEVSAATFAEAEKLVWLQMTAADRATAASNWRMQMAPLLERRTGPRKIALEATLAPATQWNPSLPGIVKPGRGGESFIRSADVGLALPATEEAIAFAPVWQLSRWIESRKLTSTRLTEIYLQRLERFNAQLRCVITLTPEHALAQARQADAEIAAGKYRGPLHGIPWGAKDLLDTAGIPTTYGAEPYRQSRSRGGRDRGGAAERGGRGAGGQAEPGRAGAERYLVWRADDESLAAGGRLFGFERGAGRGGGCRAGGLRHRQRNRRQHCEPVHALRRNGTAPHLWPRAAHRRHDAVLVARQAGADGAERGRYHAGAEGDLRAGWARSGLRAQRACDSTPRRM